MTRQNKVSLISFKGFLFLMAGVFAIAAAILVILSVSAATGTGSTPDSAIFLTEGVNTGLLGPGQQRWFKFKPGRAGGDSRVEQFLTLVFTPSDGNRIRQVSLQLFEKEQLGFFYQGEADKMTNFGAGQVVSRDGNYETGELFWTGWLFGSDTYYIQIMNGSDVTIDYWLFDDNIINYSLGEPETPPVAIISEIGSDPGHPAPLKPGLTQGTLGPNSTYWYTFTYADFSNEDRFQGRDFSMFFTPADGNRQHYVNFKLLTFSQVEIWQRGNTDELNNFGAGMLVDRDNNQNTGERVWQGTVIKGNAYLMAVENETDVEIEYWIFDSDIYNPELNPESAPPPAPVFAQGAAPQTAIPLKLGQNKGSLDPGQEVWYGFRITDYDEEYFEEMALTMITTPDDGNRIRYMTFDVFTAGGVQYWSPGDNSQINNIGAGSVVFRDDNLLTGERFWKGWLVDNDLYYVQIRNGAEVRMDYWLFTGDVYRPEL